MGLVRTVDFTPEAFTDIVTALRWLLGQAPKEELPPAVQESYDRVLEWVNDVEPKAQRPVEAGHQFEPAAFPLTRTQFRQLQSDIQHMRRGHAHASGRTRRSLVPWSIPTTVQESLEHLVTSLDDTRFTSWLVGGGLLLLALLNLVGALLSKAVPPLGIALINLAALIALIAVWGKHHFHSLATLETRFHVHIALHHHHAHFPDEHP